MGKFNKGVRKQTTLKPKGIPDRTTGGNAQFAITRVGKQSKFGPKKATTPGQHWNKPRKLGG